MRKSILARFSLALLTALVVFCFSSSAFGAATIVIQNNDAAGVGFNDPTPVAPTGGNPGTTLGQQRLNAFQFAANIWGAMLNSNSTITIKADWPALSCTSNSAVLGSAGAASIWRDFSQAPFPGTWYSSALANALTGVDLDATQQEINAHFNVNLGNPGCLDGIHFYLGLDNNHGNDTDLVTVLLHEFSHGLGFQTFTSGSNGQQAIDPQIGQSFPSIYDRFLFDNTTGKTWAQTTMTDAERQASAISVNKLAWNGPRVTIDLQSILATPLLRINSPAGIAGNYTVGTAAFGPPLSFPGITANITQASPNDGCSALTNGAAMSGKIALIDRGNCFFVVKVKNAQNAGAIGVIIANNDAANPTQVVQMGGSDATITIPSLSVSLNNGNTIKSQLGIGINASLLANTTAPSGVDTSGSALLFAPSTFSGGSSVSHWDTSEYPNQLMEPNISGDLTHSVVPVWDLTLSLLKDVGWRGNKIFDSQFFVRQHYLDFLSRSPDSSGLAFWNNEIVSCGLDQACIDLKRINVSAAFYLSIEFQETGYLVYRTYKTTFGDPDGQAVINNVPTVIKVPRVRFNEFLPDSQQIGAGVQVGIGNWQQQLENNKQAYMLAFVQRADFQSAFPSSLTADAFVTQLDTNAGNVLSASEKASLITVLGGTPNDVAKRAQVLRAVAEDDDLKTLEKNRAFVLMQYFGYLRRNPNDAPDTDHSGWKFWLDKLNAFGGDFVNAEMVKAFIVSGEYQGRFGP
jgi:hypothetical protein